MKKEISLERVKEIELNILKEVHDFCTEFGLNYVLAYGTLIGAIRHDGFIPWDDDIDIWMPRKDYDTFEKLFPDWGKKRHLYLAGPNSKDHYLPRHMMKVCDDRTVLIETKYKDYQSMGLFIDIFPVDNAPDNKVKRLVWSKYVRTYKYRALAKNIDRNSQVYKRFKLKKKVFTIVASQGNIRTIVKHFVDKAGLYKNNITRYATVFYVQIPLIYEWDDIFPAQLHKFEKYSFFVPKEYDKILSRIYGDYMKLPPKEKQIPMHTANAYIL